MDAERPRRIYHLARRDEWLQALDGGEDYRRSTLGKSLEDVGYIHCSSADQVQAIADLVYRGRPDVVLLEIDPGRVPAEVRVENLEGDQAFPHIYGPLPIEAVVQADDVPLGADGRLMVDVLIADSSA
jgi:glutathione S-transferase